MAAANCHCSATGPAFAGTIRSNLSLGLEEISDSDLWSALEIAQAKSFIEDKGGLDSPVEAFGKNFSGGQRQRLTIARYFTESTDFNLR